jgi:dienelactone hydrolase
VKADRRSARVAIGAGLALPALAILGEALAPPSFDPPPVPEGWAYPSLPALPTAETATPPQVGAIDRDEVRIPVRDTVLAGAVFAPQEPGRHPAVVFVHGAGRGSRSALADQAEYLARSGVVALVYDKRTVGYSFTSRDFDLLAENALAAVRVLRDRPEVDPARVGLRGVSEGGWVVPIAAARSPDVAFAILVCAPNVSPQSQAMWAFDDHLRRIEAPEGFRHAVIRALSMGEFNYSRHDPLPALRNVRQPVLALYGTDDRAVPVLQSSRILAQALESAGNAAFAIRFFEGANHDLRVDGGFAPGYLETMANWIVALPESGDPSHDAPVAGSPPEQARQAIEPPSPPAYGTAPVLLGAFGLAAAGSLAARPPRCCLGFVWDMSGSTRATQNAGRPSGASFGASLSPGSRRSCSPALPSDSRRPSSCWRRGRARSHTAVGSSSGREPCWRSCSKLRRSIRRSRRSVAAGSPLPRTPLPSSG